MTKADQDLLSHEARHAVVKRIQKTGLSCHAYQGSLVGSWVKWLSSGHVEWRVDGNVTLCLYTAGSYFSLGWAKRNPTTTTEYKVNGKWTKNPNPLDRLRTTMGRGQRRRAPVDIPNLELGKRLSLYRALMYTLEMANGAHLVMTPQPVQESEAAPHHAEAV